MAPTTNISVHVTGTDVHENGSVDVANATYTGDSAFCVVFDRKQHQMTGCILGNFGIDAIRDTINEIIEACGKEQAILGIYEALEGPGSALKYFFDLMANGEMEETEEND